MSNVKHTPGKWFANPAGCAVFANRGGEDAPNLICTLPTMPLHIGDRRSAEEHHANARLIAAAPELLAACRELVERDENGTLHQPSGSADRWRAKLAKAARAAIAKAGGVE